MALVKISVLRSRYKCPLPSMLHRFLDVSLSTQDQSVAGITTPVGARLKTSCAERESHLLPGEQVQF